MCTTVRRLLPWNSDRHQRSTVSPKVPPTGGVPLPTSAGTQERKNCGQNLDGTEAVRAVSTSRTEGLGTKGIRRLGRPAMVAARDHRLHTAAAVAATTTTTVLTEKKCSSGNGHWGVHPPGRSDNQGRQPERSVRAVLDGPQW